MSFTTILAIIAGSIALGGFVGYFLHRLISLGKKGSMELTVKQILLDAKAEAQRVTEDAEKKALARLEEVKTEEREKLAELKRTEERLIKKDELLDKRQTDIDKEVERLIARLQERKLSLDSAVQIALLNNPTVQATFEELGIAHFTLCRKYVI